MDFGLQNGGRNGKSFGRRRLGPQDGKPTSVITACRDYALLLYCVSVHCRFWLCWIERLLDSVYEMYFEQQRVAQRRQHFQNTVLIWSLDPYCSYPMQNANEKQTVSVLVSNPSRLKQNCSRREARRSWTIFGT